MRTCIALNSHEAVEYYSISLRENNPFSLIIMDIKMPEMDGIEATDIIRNTGQVESGGNHVQKSAPDAMDDILPMQTRLS